MRAFVALDIPDEMTKDSLVNFQGQLAATGADLKLVERQNLHFTMKFLGELNDAEAKEADRRLRQLALDGGPVTVQGVGAFPSLGRPSVVWVAVSHHDEPRVRAIAEAVIRGLAGIGEPEKRPFQAHLTLARVRSARNAGQLASLLTSESARTFGTFNLRTITLKSSKLTPGGPVYSDQGVYSLA